MTFTVGNDSSEDLETQTSAAWKKPENSKHEHYVFNNHLVFTWTLNWITLKCWIKMAAVHKCGAEIHQTIRHPSIKHCQSNFCQSNHCKSNLCQSNTCQPNLSVKHLSIKPLSIKHLPKLCQSNICQSNLCHSNSNLQKKTLPGSPRPPTS